MRSFFCFISSAVELPYWIFPVITFFSSAFCLVLYMLYISVETLNLFMNCFPDLSEHPYGHYFELPSVKSLISISLRSVSVLLFGTYPFLHFPWWSIFCALDKMATSPSLDRVISHTKCPLSSSPTLALGGLSLVCVSSFVVSGFQPLRVRQNPTIS